MPKIKEAGRRTNLQTSLWAWPLDRYTLYLLGAGLVANFCKVNRMPAPAFHDVLRGDWLVDACAYYRPDTEANRKWMVRTRGQGPGINICLELCQKPCPAHNSRNWSWPGSSVDRTPYGVLAHELGHHCDWLTGEKKWTYGSEYSERVMKDSGEPPLTSYAPDPEEWFAEMFRLFVTNSDLLLALRPATYGILKERWEPVERRHWQTVLGINVPPRVVRAQVNKGAK